MIYGPSVSAANAKYVDMLYTCVKLCYNNYVTNNTKQPTSYVLVYVGTAQSCQMSVLGSRLVECHTGIDSYCAALRKPLFQIRLKASYLDNAQRTAALNLVDRRRS